MHIVMLLILMIFAHIVDDYYLQGVLAKLKQKGTWKNLGGKYKWDYIPALICHAFSWSVLIMLPIFWLSQFNPEWWLYLVFVVNVAIHAVVDDQKANRQSINLIVDQAIHLGQILVTWLLFVCIP